MQYLKTIPPERERSALREIKALRALKHRNIPKLYAIKKYSGGYCLWMTYFPGYTLGQIVRSGRTFTVDEIIRIVYSLCEMLDYTHNNYPEVVYHLDLHPDNLIISGDRLCIVDFGNSWCGSGSPESLDRQGTPGFSAPELYTGGPVDHRTDIFSVGKIILYLCDALKDNENEATRQRLVEMAFCCTRYEPVNRIQQVSDIAAILRQLC